MSELDDLLDAERARRLGATPMPPPYAVLRERGLRRRRRRRVAAAGGGVLAVAAVLAAGQLLGGPPGGDAQPVAPTPSVTRAATPTPTPTPTVGPTSTPSTTPTAPVWADDLVDHPVARLTNLVMAPGDPDARVAVWSYCEGEGECGKPTYALAVTGNGFRTRVAVEGREADRAPLVTPLTDDAFAVAWVGNRVQVVRTDGSVTAVRVERGAGPLADGELLVDVPQGGPSAHFGLDPGTGRAHRVSVPRDAHGVVAQPDGTLHAVTWSRSRSTTVWSGDGGESWQERLISTDASTMLAVLPSAKKGVLAVLEGADGATLLPMLRLHRSTDGGLTWTSFDLQRDPRAYGQAGGVLPDGRLVVDVEGWSDDRLGTPGEKPHGLYVSDRRDWSLLTPIPGGEAPAVPKGMLTSGRDLRATATLTALRLSAVLADQGVAELSTDGGRTWERIAAR